MGIEKVYLFLGKVKKLWEDRFNLNKSLEKVFTEVYERHLWGEGSGAGSKDEEYKNMIIQYLKSHEGKEKTVVDLGCGDLQIGRSFFDHCKRYIGVDVVPELINELKSKYDKNNVSFFRLNIVEDELPDGNICLIRQVFQHLSNAEIKKVLEKLDKYETVFITEHQPEFCDIPNKDMIHSSKIRLYYNSGVYPDKPPFNLKNLKLVLESSGSIGQNFTIGKIRTYKYKE